MEVDLGKMTQLSSGHGKRIISGWQGGQESEVGGGVGGDIVLRCQGGSRLKCVVCERVSVCMCVC